jgi:bacterioferritin
VPSINNQKVVDQLNRILECELAGVVRYTHYSMMIFGYSRIPIVSWFQAEATESLAHAQQAGEMVTRLGGHPSLAIGPLLETHQHDIGEILRETLQAEHTALGHYKKLLVLVADKNIALEEYARSLIAQEEAHIDEIDKMLRKPGDTERSKEARSLK